MQDFVYHSSTEVIFGKGAELKVPEAAKRYGATRILLVYGGGSVVRSGLLGKMENALRDAGLFVQSFGGAKPNPRLQHARDGVKAALETKADLILAVGGGSVLDTAKAIAIGAANPETDIWEFWLRKKKVEKALPIGTVLTISASGSETSDSAVLTDEETNTKRGLNCYQNRPKFSALDPELTYTLPKHQIACGVVDIMMHTMDRYFNPVVTNEVTDAIAEALLRVVVANGPKALENPHDYQPMSELMWAGSLSHNGLTGLGGKMDFAPHQLGHELSGKFDATHGASLSTIWGAWATHCWRTDPARFVRFGKNVWSVEDANPEKAVPKTIATVNSYFRSLDMPTCFSELGIGVQPDEVLRDLARRCMFNDTRTIGTFQVLNGSDAYEIYKLANH